MCYWTRVQQDSQRPRWIGLRGTHRRVTSHWAGSVDPGGPPSAPRHLPLWPSSMVEEQGDVAAERRPESKRRVFSTRRYQCAEPHRSDRSTILLCPLSAGIPKAINAPLEFIGTLLRRWSRTNSHAPHMWDHRRIACQAIATTLQCSYLIR